MANYDVKLSSVLKVLSENTGLSNLVPGTIGYQLGQSITFLSYLKEQKIDDDANNNSISNATGTNLDYIGNNFFGIYRKEGKLPYISGSMKTIKFSVTSGRIFGDINGGNDIVLTQGTTIYGDIGGVIQRFALDTDQVLTANLTETYVSATLIQGSTTSIPVNTLKNHTFINYTDYQSKSLLVTNDTYILTGSETQTDADYRYAIKTGLRSFNQAITDGILSVVRNVQGVSNATIYAARDGSGTFTVYVQGITPITSDETITDVMVILEQECVSPWVSCNVVKPEYIGVNLSVTLTLSTLPDLTTQTQYITSMEDQITTFINNNNVYKLYISDIQKFIINSDSNIVDVKFNFIRTYTGDNSFRQYEDLDLTTTKYIERSDLEQIITEPITNSILVTLV